MGEPILLHRLHRNMFAIVHYSITGHFFAVEAISTRE